MVLRDAEIHEGAVSADPARAISARPSRDAIGDGLPILSQLCRSRGAIERAKHAAVHELPHTGAKRQPEARTGTRKLEDRQPDRLGVDSSNGRLRLLQSLRACEPRCQLL